MAMMEMLPEALQGLTAVVGDEHLRPLAPEEHLRDLGIELVALGQEEMQAPDVRGGFLSGGLGLRRRRDVKGAGDGKGGPLPQPALHPDDAVHLFHQALDDGHPQAGALIDAAGVAALLGKGLENALQELLAHAHAGVGDGPAIGAAALLRRDSLHDGGDFPPGRLYLMQLP